MDNKKECEICRKKIEDIREDIILNENEQKKEIDYLKKIRIKSRIKSIFLAIVLFLTIVFMIYLIKFSKITLIANKGEKNLKSDNMYIEIVQAGNSIVPHIEKTYFKEGKYKKVYEFYIDGEFEQERIVYGEVSSDEIKSVYDNEKKVVVEKGEFIKKSYNSEENIKTGNIKPNTLYCNLGKAILMSIESDNYEIGKEYYILKYKYEKGNRTEYWYDKETGLILRNINREAEKIYFPGTNIVSETGDIEISYNYEFGGVTDDDVNIPDLSNYEIEYNDYLESLIKEAE